MFFLIGALILAFAVHNIISFVSTPNPFVNDTRRKRGPYLKKQKEKDVILKQGFSQV